MEGKCSRIGSWFVFILVTLLLGSAAPAVMSADLSSDTSALMSFLSGLEAAPRVQWLSNVTVCAWQGVYCNADKSRVEMLHLPGVGLTGRIPDGALGSLSELRVLSLRSNKLSGPLPSDLSNCTQLRSLYLQSNALSGPLPPLSGLPPLIRLNLANNNFSGPISPSYARLRRLGTLYLQNNALSGGLPEFISLLPDLTQFSVANNALNGSVPALLQKKFGVSAFEGNDFCGKPYFKLCAGSIAFAPAEAPSGAHRKGSKRLSKVYIVAIIAGAAGLAFFLLACCVAWFLIKRRGRSSDADQGGRKSTHEGGIATVKTFDVQGKGEDFSSAAEKESNKLVFFEGGTSTFDLEDLLRASAEVLGKGSAGTAYKAVLEDGTTVVVKRLKDVSVGRKEFEQHMASLGNLRHRHLVPLRAYYYSKDEKLVLYDYMPLGSLSALLHGNKGARRTALDWDTRVKIATGAAKGLAFLHDNRFTHGNIKSSNVLLKRHYDTTISDFGLAPLFGTSPAASRILGYRAPEVLETRRISSQADVYSYGVLLLELLTGKAPTQISSEEGVDLPRWVQSVVREEWTAEVFDVELLRYDNIEEEMVQMLQIAMSCVATSPDQRPTMSQVVKMIEDVRAFETDDTNRQSSSDKSKESNGHTPQRTEPSTPARITP